MLRVVFMHYFDVATDFIVVAEFFSADAPAYAVATLFSIFLPACIQANIPFIFALLSALFSANDSLPMTFVGQRASAGKSTTSSKQEERAQCSGLATWSAAARRLALRRCF